MKNDEKLQERTEKKKPSIKKYIIALSLFLFLLIALLFLVYSNQREPEPDLLSEKLILKEAGWPFGKDPNDITDRDFRRVSEIILGKRNYVDYSPGPVLRIRDFGTSELCDIKAIEKLTNLQHLDLDTIRRPQEKIPKWMKFMAKLGIMNLDKRFKIDLKPIEKLQNLRSLGIFDTPVSNFESIKDLANLKSLILYNTNISDLEPLRKLTNLECLDLANLHISTLEPLKNLNNLRILNLHDNLMSDLEPLKEIKSLRRLDIRNCPNITDQQVLDLQKALPDLEIIR